MMQTLTRCRGRAFDDDEFLAPECQTCERFVAHFNAGHGDAGSEALKQTEPTAAIPCPDRIAIPLHEGA